MRELVFLVCGFLIGAIPTAYLYGKYVHKIDIREHGSGNIGATNSMRVLGKKAGAIVLVLDLLKALMPILLVKYFFKLPDLALFVGLATVLGHVFSPYLKFKGGKGIATSLGMLLGIDPLAAVVCLAVFILMVYFSRMVSLGSIMAAFTFMVYNLILNYSDKPLIYTSLGLFFLLMYTHKKNISLILKNKENKI